jgi:hypothetical protein
MVPFLDYLRVELSGRGLVCCTVADLTSGATAAASVRVSIEIVPCSSDGEGVQLSARDLANSRGADRRVSLSDIAPAARPRALALVVAELIRSLGQPAPDDAAPRVAVSTEGSPPKVAELERPRPSRVSINLEGEARLLPSRDTTMWGGRVRLVAPWRWLHADLDLGADYASAQVDLGEVLLRSATVGVTVGPRFPAQVAIIDLGLRAELGWAWIRGETGLADVRAQSGSDLVSSMGLRASLEIPARMTVRPSLALEGGYVLHGVKGEADAQAVVGMTGYYLLATLGIAVSP